MTTHPEPAPHRRLWLIFAATLFIAFFVLGFFGREVYRQAPPLPDRVVTTDGRVLMTKNDILTGQQVWQSTGGQQLGSIWGHGAYQAPDWSADWLHRESVALLDVWAEREGAPRLDALPRERQAVLRDRLTREMRANTYEAANGIVTVSTDRAAAMARAAAHYDGLYGGRSDLQELRQHYAMQEQAVPDPARRRALTAFFFWTSWAATTTRPGT